VLSRGSGDVSLSSPRPPLVVRFTYPSFSGLIPCQRLLRSPASKAIRRPVKARGCTSPVARTRCSRKNRRTRYFHARRHRPPSESDSRVPETACPVVRPLQPNAPPVWPTTAPSALAMVRRSDDVAPRPALTQGSERPPLPSVPPESSGLPTLPFHAMPVRYLAGHDEAADVRRSIGQW